MENANSQCFFGFVTEFSAGARPTVGNVTLTPWVLAKALYIELEATCFAVLVGSSLEEEYT